MLDPAQEQGGDLQKPARGQDSRRKGRGLRPEEEGNRILWSDHQSSPIEKQGVQGGNTNSQGKQVCEE